MFGREVRDRYDFQLPLRQRECTLRDLFICHAVAGIKNHIHRRERVWTVQTERQQHAFRLAITVTRGRHVP